MLILILFLKNSLGKYINLNSYWLVDYILFPTVSKDLWFTMKLYKSCAMYDSWSIFYKIMYFADFVNLRIKQDNIVYWNS